MLSDYCKKKKLTLFGLLPLALSISIFCANPDETKSPCDFDEFDHCNSELSIGQLWAKKINAKCEEVHSLKARKIVSESICTKDLNVEDHTHFGPIEAHSICAHSVDAGKMATYYACANHLNVWKDACVGTLDAQSVCTNALSSSAITSDALCSRLINVSEQLCASGVVGESVCATNLIANTGCINTLTVGNLLNCGLYRATMTFATNQTYDLGAPINWNTILDDPNHDCSLSPVTTYTAPVSGYYVIFLQLDQDNVTGAATILGVPVANLQLLVNGNLFRQTFIPFLTFHNEQKATVSGLLSLKAGDIITTQYHVLVMADSVGLSDYVGTCDIVGTGTEENGSVFKIHLLSIDCADNTPCAPCGTGESGTTGCLQDCPALCTPCTSIQCKPCTPHHHPVTCVASPCPKPCCTPCVPCTGPTGYTGNLGKSNNAGRVGYKA